MRVGGQRMRDHIRLLLPFFGLVTAVWLIRLLLAAAGAPHTVSQIASVSIAEVVAVLLAVVRFHIRDFGSYPNVVVASLLLCAYAQLLIVAAILASVLTGVENIYTAPEFSMPGDDANHLLHMYGHLTFGIGIGTLAGTGVGSLMLFMLRKLVPMKQT